MTEQNRVYHPVWGHVTATPVDADERDRYLTQGWLPDPIGSKATAKTKTPAKGATATDTPEG